MIVDLVLTVTNKHVLPARVAAVAVREADLRMQPIKLEYCDCPFFIVPGEDVDRLEASLRFAKREFGS